MLPPKKPDLDMAVKHYLAEQYFQQAQESEQAKQQAIDDLIWQSSQRELAARRIVRTSDSIQQRIQIVLNYMNAPGYQYSYMDKYYLMNPEEIPEGYPYTDLELWSQLQDDPHPNLRARIKAIVASSPGLFPLAEEYIQEHQPVYVERVHVTNDTPWDWLNNLWDGIKLVLLYLFYALLALFILYMILTFAVGI